MSSNAGRAAARVLLALEMVFLAVSRAIFWTPYPTNFDYANFALGVDHFSPFYHQPHPPGYPLVVLLAKGFVALGAPGVLALHLTALVGSVLAVLGAYWLGKRLAGEAGGVLASALLAIEPVFWYSGVSSPTRVYIAAGVCWVLYWLLELAEGSGKGSMWIAAAVLALFGGFRPELLLLLAPAFAVASRRAGLGWTTLPKAAAFCALLSLPWVLWMARTFGSLFRMTYVYYYYFLHHVSTTSFLMGAPPSSWHRMVRQALVWNALPAVLAAALGLSRNRAKLNRSFLIIGGAYLLPALIVQFCLHEGPESPDHSLGTIAVFCVVAGSLIATSRFLWLAGAGAAAMLALSFSSPGARSPELDILSLRSFARSQGERAGIINRLKQSLRPGDAVVLLNDSPIPWRILEFEFPKTVVFALQATVQPTPAEPGSGWRIFERSPIALAGASISLAGEQSLYVIANPDGPQRKLVVELLCSRFTCTAARAELRVDLKGAAGQAVSLPPYTLRLDGG